MKAPDGTEGKKARCPACSAITRIPAAAAVATSVPVANVASPAPQPFTEVPPVVGDNPFAAPSTTDFSGAMERTGHHRLGAPSWDAKPSIGSFFKTSIEVLTKPKETFGNLIPDAGLGRPMTYGAIVGAVTGLLFGGLAVLMITFMAASGANNGNGGAPPAGVMMGVAAGALILLPLMYAVLFPIGALMGAGFLHLMLMLVGAKKYDYSATARCVSYMYFAAWPITLITMIPFLGVIVAIPLGIWMIAIYIIGLAEVHETTKTRVAIAVLIPAFAMIALAILAAAIGQVA